MPPCCRAAVVLLRALRSPGSVHPAHLSQPPLPHARSQEKLVAYEKEESQRLQKELEEAQQQQQKQQKAKQEEDASPKKKKKKKDGKPLAAGGGGWKEHKAKDGRTYWYNKKTKESSWTDPNGG